MTDRPKPDLLFDFIVQNIKNLKKILYNSYAVTLEEVDNVTRIGVEQ